jgi:hypothetical protein
LYNHKPLKAAVVAGGEGYLIYRIVKELNLQNDALDRQQEAIDNGDAVAESVAVFEANLHRDRKITWIWWTVTAHLLQMADAYVDAHLAPFAAGLREEDRSSALLREPGAMAVGPPLPRDPALTLAVRVRF